MIPSSGMAPALWTGTMSHQRLPQLAFDGSSALDMTVPAEPGKLDEAESGIIRVPCEAISRPLADGQEAGQQDETVHTGFIADWRLADLLFQRRLRRVGPGLVHADGKRYAIEIAVKILGRADGVSDPYGLTGVAESMSELVRAGAEFSGHTMALGSATYDVERGVLAVLREDAPAAAYDPSFELLQRLG
jgi:hypothetical protein